MRLAHALCLLLGICAGVFQHQLPTSVWLIALPLMVLGAALLCFFLRERQQLKALNQTLLFAALIVGSYGYASWSAQQVMAHRLSGVAAGGAEFEITATVVDLPKRSDRQTRLSLQIDPESISETNAENAALAAVENLRVGYYGESEILAGERWRMRVKLRRPHGEVNPAGFDFEKVAAANRIDAVGYIVQLRERVQAAQGVTALRARLSAEIGKVIETPLERALMQALAVGDTRGLSDADWDLVREYGLTHLIAISGLHVTLLATLGAACAFGLCWLFPALTRRFPRPQLAAAVGLLCAAGYAVLAGFGVPAQRTLLMLAAVLLGVLLKRVHSLWQGFALALGVILLFDPLVVLNAGAWLSFTAVALLIVVFSQRYPRPSWWRELIGAQVLMTFGLLPLTLVFFAQASLLAPFANLLAVPLVSLLIVPLVLAATVLLLCSAAALAAPLLHLAAALWHGLLLVLGWVATPTLTSWSSATPHILLVILALLGVALMFAPRGVPFRRFGWLCLLPLLLPKPTQSPPPGEFRVTVFDVGQGLSALIQTQHHSLLFDAGPGTPEGANAGESAVVPSLRELGIRELSMIMLSHADTDHAGGLNAVLQAFPSPLYTSAIAQTPRALACESGQSWQWDGVQFRVLHPNPGLPYLRNQSSCVLHVRSTINAASALFPGDIDETIESRLLRTQAAHLPSSLLVAPHHGSATSSSGEFLQVVQPKVVIYPAGYANRFDFPRPATQARVQAVGAKEFITGDLGALSAEYDAKDGNWVLSSERAEQLRWWR